MSPQAIAQKYISMLPKSNNGITMAMPKFIMTNQLTARWNGLAIPEPDGTCTIKVQKRIMKDERSLNRIIAHEVCHAWAFFVVKVGQQPISWSRGHEPSGGWYEAAQIINRHEGEDFVSKFSDETYVEQNEKKFWVYVERSPGGLFWAWFSRATEAMGHALSRRISMADAHKRPCSVFKTDDARFLISGAKLPTAARLEEMPDDLTEKLDRILRDDPITPDSPRDIRILMSQAKTARLITARRPIRFYR